ncbi:thioredoxin family protein [Belliella sp. R4-6]|uniref:Thioredoxin family protein n=2 Tax=Belliella alkalica TaxID=1730871 RepID=A0ABS9V8H4_9BACT|nr:thioredoxin family protein [Belliella alkalica]
MDQFNQLLIQFPAALIYLYQEDCGICTVLYPKVCEMLDKDFPKMEMIILHAEQNRELAAQIRMLSVPGIILYFDGKEFFRSAGVVTVSELKSRIGRLYEMFF